MNKSLIRLYDISVSVSLLYLHIFIYNVYLIIQVESHSKALKVCVPNLHCGKWNRLELFPYRPQS